MKTIVLKCLKAFENKYNDEFVLKLIEIHIKCLFLDNFFLCLPDDFLAPNSLENEDKILE